MSSIYAQLAKPHEKCSPTCSSPACGARLGDNLHEQQWRGENKHCGDKSASSAGCRGRIRWVLVVRGQAAAAAAMSPMKVCSRELLQLTVKKNNFCPDGLSLGVVAVMRPVQAVVAGLLSHHSAGPAEMASALQQGHARS